MNGRELLRGLKATGTGEAKLDVGRKVILANRDADALEVYSALAQAGITEGTLVKARALMQGKTVEQILYGSAISKDSLQPEEEDFPYADRSLIQAPKPTWPKPDIIDAKDEERLAREPAHSLPPREPVTVEPPKHEPVKVEPLRPEPPKHEPPRPEPSRHEPPAPVREQPKVEEVPSPISHRSPAPTPGHGFGHGKHKG